MQAQIETKPRPYSRFRKFYNNNKGWLYMLPIIILMSVFTFYPLVKTILISFDPTFDPQEQIINFNKFSFEMYKKLSGSLTTSGKYVKSDFGQYIKNTVLIVFISVPLSTIIALAISAGLMSIKKVRSFFQTIYFLPYITNTIAIGMVFAVLYDYNNGLINEFLKLFGMSKVNWLTRGNAIQNIPSPKYSAMMTVALTYIIWQGLPFKILIFVGAIQSINPQYYQAAQIDHASKWKTFRRITIPQISPMILYIVITSLIGAFKTYAAIIGLFPPDGEEIRKMNTIVGYVYKQLSGTDKAYPLAAAAAVVLFSIILLMTGINTYFAKKRVHY